MNSRAYNDNARRWLPALLILFILVFFKGNVRAQAAPDFLVSWNAATYVPAGFAGKALPVRGSTVDVAFELVANGKLVDLSKTTIRWFIDNELYRSGVGLKRFSFEVPAAASSDLRLKIVVLNYQKRNLEKAMTMPVVRPEVVVSRPSVDNRIAAGTLTLKALPYFFSVEALRDLSFRWSANGVETAGEVARPDTVTLDASAGKPGNTIAVNVGVSNPRKAIEAAGISLNLEIK